MNTQTKFCILAAGRGTRNNVIDGLHKGLLPLNNKAVISHIINKLPTWMEVVVAVGFKSDQIKAYLGLVYPDRRITYVDIENYDGAGSGPGFSLLSCREHLQCPFLFTSVDTLIQESYPLDLEYDWVGVSSIDSAESCTYCLVDGDVFLKRFFYGTGDRCFIGLAGIHNYELFWKALSRAQSTNGENQVIHGFSDLKNVELINFKWHDTGNNRSYAATKNFFTNDVVAPKANEAIFIDNNYVIKYFSDKGVVDRRTSRLKYLNNTCPAVQRIHENMYCYKLIRGELLSNITNLSILKAILPFWHYRLGGIRFDYNEDFFKNCELMYRQKTIDRCRPFFGTELDQIPSINGKSVGAIEKMLQKVNWGSIYELAVPSLFHGDFQPENIVYSNNYFVLLDWRDSFGDNLKIGDLYYDLAKMYHALLVNGTDINKKLYEVSINKKEACISHHIRDNLLFLLKEFESFCHKNSYSWDNVKLLGILQYLTIADLYKDFHCGEYRRFLFLYGKYLLAEYQATH